MTHPNLFFSQNDIVKFRERLKTDSGLRERYEAVVKDADACIKEENVTWERANGNTVSQHADFGLLNHQANRFCHVLGTKYIVEGSAECAERLKNLLLNLISFKRWFSLAYETRKPVPWHSDLCSAATTLAAAKIYDVIFDYLTEEERRTIANGILEKGVYPAFSDWVFHETRIHALDSMGHNWWAVCTAEAAAAFLAVSDYVEEEKKKEILSLVDSSLSQYMTYPGNPVFNKFGNFDRQGLFYESIGYNNFGTGSLLRYLWCFERYYGENAAIRRAIPAGLTDSLMAFSYPIIENGKKKFAFLNFGDSGFDQVPDLLAKFAVRLGLGGAALKEYVCGVEPDMWEEIEGFYPNKLSGSVEALPKTQLFSSGFAVARDSWQPDSRLFAVKCGYCWNHSHNDSGTFVIFDKGRPFFIDSGTCTYTLPQYHAYYCQDKAHSVLKFGRGGRRDEELYRGTKFPGSITDSFEGEDFFFVQADTAGPLAHLCSRAFRNFFWIQNKVLVIIDEAYCHEDDSCEFTLHFDGEYRERDGAVDFVSGESTARLTFVEPKGMKAAEEIGHFDHAQDEDKVYLKFTDGQKRRAHLIISALQLDSGENAVDMRRISGETETGIGFDLNGTEYEILFNGRADGSVMHDNSNSIISGWETDAYILMKAKKDGNERAFAVCASYLRKNGKAFLGAFAKKTEEVIINEA